MAMNGGQMPPMTPLDERAKKFIEPAFTPGMGALEEDPEKGLRCPVRGCGRFFHLLATHISHEHRAIGGAAAVRAALDIPTRVSLLSAKQRLIQEDAARRRFEQRVRSGTAPIPPHRPRGTPKGHGVSVSCSKRSTANRNLADRCQAQLAHRLADLTSEIGRTPSQREWRSRYPDVSEGFIRSAYGSWNSFLAQCGVLIRRGPNRHLTVDGVLDAMGAFHAEHGDLPSAYEAHFLHRAPIIPSRRAVLRAMGASTWEEAMSQVAAALNIVGGRYGLPEPTAVAS
jgi:hypothetical protein